MDTDFKIRNIMKTHQLWNVNFLNQIIETMANGLFTLDISGKITSWNPAMERITGYTAEEAVGESCSLLNFNRCFSKSCPAGIRECGIYKHGRIDGKECFLKHKNGKDVPVIKSARILRDKNDSISRILE